MSELALVIPVLLMLPALAVSGEAILGGLPFPEQWAVFTSPSRSDPISSPREEAAKAKQRVRTALALPAPGLFKAVPKTVIVDGEAQTSRKVTPTNNQFDFGPLIGAPPYGDGLPPLPDYVAWGRMAHVFVPLESGKEQEVTLGMGADVYLRAWLNGEEILDTTDERDPSWPPTIRDHLVNVRLRRGLNILVVRFISGKGSSVLALGGPRELRAGNYKSVVSDPFLRRDKRWLRSDLRVKLGGKTAVDIGSRRELFVDDLLIDGMSGSADRRLHHPTPREVVLEFDRPWEGGTCAYFTALQADGQIRLYYSGRPPKGRQAACVVESEDGVHFTRPSLGLYDFEGSKDNNIVWRRAASGHNFSPFRDANPDAPADQRYKAVAYHPNGGGLGVYASPDGIRWRMLTEEKVITEGAFDSQNIAFWDSELEMYVDYHRGSAATGPQRGLRNIMRAVSKDFIHWSEPELLVYADERREHMYTNGILSYFRAPHIYIGLPARFVPQRKRIPEHTHNGISDAILMSSRDGKLFRRWEEGFVRPGPEPEVWTDRNNYPAWGLVQTSPTELSLYWTEHYRHPGMRLRRGAIRVDGFVSIHAGSEVGEILTRPLVFSGNRLTVNYATSAVGALRFELCDRPDEPFKGFSLADSDLVFGNEVERTITWNSRHDLSELAGKDVRLRVRMQDADLYSIRFAE